MVVNDQGSVVVFTPEGDYEYEWLMLNTDNEPWQWQGRSLVVDHRPAQGLVEYLESEGFIIDRA